MMNHELGPKKRDMATWYDKDYVKKDWRNLEHASDRLRNDEELVALAVKTTPHALKYASRRLRRLYTGEDHPRR